MSEDYIRKQDASDWLKQYGQDVLHGKYKFSLMYIWKNIMDLPSADVAPVVRCRDCDCHGTCTHEQYLGMDGFCSHGERKNDVPTNIIESLKEEINTVNRLNDRIKNRGNNG